jgi:bifunctional DNA-binding transcriptional regulator/antitoxin component of YhaV-PrlF toxin-antitoxin module
MTSIVKNRPKLKNTSVLRLKNQLTIPKEIIEVRGDAEGTKYIFEVTKDGFIARKIIDRTDEFYGKFKDKFPKDKTALQILKAARALDGE